MVYVCIYLSLSLSLSTCEVNAGGTQPNYMQNLAVEFGVRPGRGERDVHLRRLGAHLQIPLPSASLGHLFPAPPPVCRGLLIVADGSRPLHLTGCLLVPLFVPTPPRCSARPLCFVPCHGFQQAQRRRSQETSQTFSSCTNQGIWTTSKGIPKARLRSVSLRATLDLSLLLC